MRKSWLIAAALALAGAANQAGAQAPDPTCHVGVYRVAGGGLLDVGRTNDGLRWRLLDGETGRLVREKDGLKSYIGWTKTAAADAPDLGACDDDIAFRGQPGKRIALRVVDTTFEGADGVKLAGRLVLPPGDAAVPVSVLIHGSEDTSAREFQFEQRAWPANGVGVFVYDKRGTGGSAGKYTQDFHVLAKDAAAAVQTARNLAGGRAARVGVDGASQGGWVGPLIATLTPVDFVIARYGMLESPLAEDRGEVMLGLTERGHGPDVLRKADEVVDAAHNVMASRFKEGWDQLAAVKAKYGQEPWFKDVQGEFTGELFRYPPAVVKMVGPSRDKGTTWRHDPMPVIRAVNVPVLWILASEDREAPVVETRARLLTLATEGRDVTAIEFPGADHGIRQFTQTPAGRQYTRYADGYYQAVLDFTRHGALPKKAYGESRRLTP
jgi:dienelactone hydrolase